MCCTIIKMTIQTWLTDAQRQLEAAGIGTARLDALVLLEDVIGKERGWSLAHGEAELTADKIEKLSALLHRRITHEPLAYIREKCEFYGREFSVNRHVLVPRPESETMIDCLKQLPLSANGALSLADIGTGSGALGITAALELPAIRQLRLIDIDPAALDVAKHNAQRYAVDAKCIEADLLGKDTGPLDIILANLPYVPDSHTINEAAMREPAIAIFGGPDGLDLYRRLFAQLSAKPWRPRYIITESLPFQHDTLAAIAQKAAFRQQSEADFIQVFG